jgi:hypothetical protein
VNVAELRRILADWPPQTPVAVRTVEKGEVCLTVSLTSADQLDASDGAVDGLVLIGNLDEAAS